MSDRYLDPSRMGTCENGTPDMREELKYRLEHHKGRSSFLSDFQFEMQYLSNDPGPRKRNDFDPEMFGVSR